MQFDGLSRSWALDVAEAFRDIALRHAQPVLDELWLAADLTLLTRYRVGAGDLGARFVLDVDPTSNGTPTDSGRLASDLYHNLHADPGPDAWVDEDGRPWWGDEPDDGWESAVRSDRLETLLPRG